MNHENFLKMLGWLHEDTWPTLDEADSITNPPLRKGEYYARVRQTRIDPPTKRLYSVFTTGREPKNWSQHHILPLPPMQSGPGTTRNLDRPLMAALLEARYRIAISVHPQPVCRCNAMDVAHKHEDNGIFPWIK